MDLFKAIEEMSKKTDTTISITYYADWEFQVYSQRIRAMRIITPDFLKGLKLMYFFCFNHSLLIEDGEKDANRIETLNKKCKESFSAYSSGKGLWLMNFYNIKAPQYAERTFKRVFEKSENSYLIGDD